MKKNLVFGLSIALMGCAFHSEDITVQYSGKTAKVIEKEKDSVNVTVKGANVKIESLYKEHKLTLSLTGQSDNGQLILKTADKAQVKLNGLSMTSQEGAPIWLKNNKKVELVATKGTENTLTITACNDTTNHKAAVIWAKDKLQLSGEGTLNIIATGDGCRGIKTKKDIDIEELTLNVTTSGDNLGEKPFGFGGFPGMPQGGFPNFPDSFPNFPNCFPNIPDSFPNFPNGFPNIPDSFPNFPNGFPGTSGAFPFDNDSTMRDGFPGGGFGGKHKYVASTKGITSKGKIIINSGNVTVRTSTAGAEGIEGKEGITFNGGTVDVLTTDDAINANGTIEFNGAHVIARSKGNDAVDSNPEGGFFPPFGGASEQKNTPAIVITGGTIYAWSQVGSPEEGLDCDFAPLVVEGGTVFTVGGGMGEMPSVPTNETAKQPTVLLIGIDITKDEPVNIYDTNDHLILNVTVPFSLRRSATIISCSDFKVGSSYTIKTMGYEKSFTINDPFTTVR